MTKMQRILVPMDNSPHSKEALKHAASEYSDAEITVLHVIDLGKMGDPGIRVAGDALKQAEQWEENAKARAEELFAEAEEIAAEFGVGISTELETGLPRRAITSYADNRVIDHIVMGSHGRRGVKRLLIGSVAESVLRHSTVPVTVVR